MTLQHRAFVQILHFRDFNNPGFAKPSKNERQQILTGYSIR